MTLKELKLNMADLGFDTVDELMSTTDGEQQSIMLTSANRAIEIVYHTIVERYEKYFEEELSTDDKKWELKEPTPLTLETSDDFEIEIPEKLMCLVPILASHYAWLDDDIQKATTYWNEYDDLKNQLIEDMDRPRKFQFHNFGYGW